MIRKLGAKSLLDIGCGTGEFLNEAQIKGLMCAYRAFRKSKRSVPKKIIT